jgi:hypothetical protein
MGLTMKLPRISRTVDDIKDAFKGDSDIKRALTAYLDNDKSYEDEDEVEDDTDESEDEVWEN